MCQRGESGMLRFAITAGGTLLGGIGVEHGELGYWLAEPHWSKGYETEAARAIADHAFGVMDLKPMIARHWRRHRGDAP